MQVYYVCTEQTHVHQLHLGCCSITVELPFIDAVLSHIFLHCGFRGVFNVIMWYLSVFRSVESEVYEIAVSLAKTYHVPLWDVYMIHLEFLFDENESQYVCLL